MRLSANDIFRMAQRGVDAVNIADSPLARIRMSNMALAYLIHAHFPRLEIILHFTTRDRNLMALQSGTNCG